MNSTSMQGAGTRPPPSGSTALQLPAAAPTTALHCSTLHALGHSHPEPFPPPPQPFRLLPLWPILSHRCVEFAKSKNSQRQELESLVKLIPGIGMAGIQLPVFHRQLLHGVPRLKLLYIGHASPSLFRSCDSMTMYELDALA